MPALFISFASELHSPVNTRLLRRWLQVSFSVALLVGMLTSGWSADGPETEGPAAAASASAVVRELQRQLNAAKADESLPEALKQTTIEALERALEATNAAEVHVSQAAEWKRQLATAPTRLGEVQQQLTAAAARQPLNLDPTVELEQVEALLEQKVAALEEPDTGLKDRLTAIERKRARRTQRLEDIPGELNEVRAALANQEQILATAEWSNQPADIATVLQQAAEAEMLLLDRRRVALEVEQDWLQADESEQLLRLERELIDQEIRIADAEVELLQGRVAVLRQQAADEQLRQAEALTDRLPPVLRPAAEINEQLARQNRELTEQQTELEADVTSTSDRLDQLTAEAIRIEDMVTAVGLTESIGLLLRKQRAQLTDVRQLRGRVAIREETVRDLRLQMFQLDEPTAALRSVDTAASRELAAIPEVQQGRVTMNDALREQMRQLLTTRKELYDEQLRLLNDVFRASVNLDTAELKLADRAAQYAEFIDERVLWIRTGAPYGLRQLRQIEPALEWCINPAKWRDLGRRLLVDLQQHPWLSGTIGVLLIIGLVARRRIKFRLRELGAYACTPQCTTIVPTLLATLLTVLLAALWPLLAALIGWRLMVLGRGDTFLRAVGLAAMSTAAVVFPLECLRLLATRRGVGRLHFDWPDDRAAKVARHALGLLAIGAPLVFALGLVVGSEREPFTDALGRPLFMALCLSLAWTNWRLLHTWPSSSLDLWGGRVAGPLRGLAVGAPLVLFLLTASGYFYTALQLGVRAEWTIWLLLTLLMAQSVCLRSIVLARRRMAIERAAAPVGPKVMSQLRDTEGIFRLDEQAWPELKVDLSTIVEQLKSLLRAGLITFAFIGMWGIWSDILPALSVLDRWTLWTVAADGPADPASGGNATPAIGDAGTANSGASAALRSQGRPVTVASLGLAIVIFGLALFAAQNIPGLLETLILDRLNVDGGIHVAVISLVRYALALIGVVAACGQLGISWSSVQWLVAAATVGLGFGMQEIFANFVSGIIILFERPMRVGDVITIGETTGTVSRIRFRATTILDWDRKELVVPNKEFITGRLLNWTLSDKINRLVVKIGVAYGSDLQLVRRVLQEVLDGCEELLREPAPSITFEEFGASTLNLTIRGFLPDLEERLGTIDRLHEQIYQRFNEAGIELAFPQLDLHVKSLPAGSLQPPGTTARAGEHAA